MGEFGRSVSVVLGDRVGTAVSLRRMSENTEVSQKAFQLSGCNSAPLLIYVVDWLRSSSRCLQEHDIACSLEKIAKATSCTRLPGIRPHPF